MNAIHGFGEYTLPQGKTFPQMQCAQKAQKIAIALLFGVLTFASVLIIPISIPIAIIGIAAFSYLTIKSILAAIGLYYRTPPLNHLYPPGALQQISPLNEISNIPCTGFPTEDSKDSQKWKLELIRSAQHDIVLSGCYCGGEHFDETLDLINERMRALPNLCTSIIASQLFITKENQKRIQSLTQEFGPRFSCIATPEVFPYTSPVTGRFATTTNHTKALIIDYGAYFMTGGTGIHDSWTKHTGAYNPGGRCFNQNLYDNLLGARSYRDMDFVLHSELNGVGTRLYVEFIKLIEQFRYRKTGQFHSPPPLPETVDTLCPLFEANPQKIENLKIACYVSGPEQQDNAFLKELIFQTDQAQESIVFDHMYFHPMPEFLDALIRASNRGVHITIVTNKLFASSPGSHMFFAELSRHRVRALFQGRPNPNIEFFEYSIPYSTLHKKNIIFDRKISFGGSTNIGQKSLGGTDYEDNFKIESEAFAAALLQSIELDKALCQKVVHPERLPVQTCLCLPIQLLATPYL